MGSDLVQERELQEVRRLSANKFEKKFQDRPYQRRLMDDVVNDWRGNNQYNTKIRSSLIELPPGSGKTVIGFKLAKTFKDIVGEINGWDPADVGIGWVAGRRNLLKQAEIENNALVECPDVHFVSQFAHDLSSSELFNYKHKFLVIDEAHHEACASTHNIINAFDPEYMLGLSATPKRSDRAKLCFQKNYHNAGFYTLIDEGWLANFDHWNIPDWDPDTVVARYLDDPELWGKSIMFFSVRGQCERAVKLLSNAGISVDLVTGTTDRDAQITAFENGELDVLVNMFVLTEGFDCPELNTVWVRDSTELPTIQMAGRVLRPHEDIPVVNIVQSVKTRWPFVRTANIAKHQYVWSDDYWQRVDRNDKIDKKIIETVRTLASIEPESNDILKKLRSKNFPRRRRRRRG